MPNIVPTPCIEALFAVASVPGSVSPKRLKTSNDGETRAAVVPIAKSLILGGFMVRDQETGGSACPTIRLRWRNEGGAWPR